MTPFHRIRHHYGALKRCSFEERNDYLKQVGEYIETAASDLRELPAEATPDGVDANSLAFNSWNLLQIQLEAAQRADASEWERLRDSLYRVLVLQHLALAGARAGAREAVPA